MTSCRMSTKATGGAHTSRDAEHNDELLELGRIVTCRVTSCAAKALPSLLLLWASPLKCLDPLHQRLLGRIKGHRCLGSPANRGGGAPVRRGRRQVVVHRELPQCIRVMPRRVSDAVEVEVRVGAPEGVLLLALSLVRLNLSHIVLRCAGRQRARTRRNKALSAPSALAARHTKSSVGAHPLRRRFAAPGAGGAPAVGGGGSSDGDMARCRHHGRGGPGHAWARVRESLCAQKVEEVHQILQLVLRGVAGAAAVLRAKLTPGCLEVGGLSVHDLQHLTGHLHLPRAIETGAGDGDLRA
mmetsp:Transcript_33273/g.93954  ORF Transcript_33273/g.93954 Transcript_33273/m.93954 type:complete len:298 (+) Transcript_33273:120-1013(+)